MHKCKFYVSTLFLYIKAFFFSFFYLASSVTSSNFSCTKIAVMMLDFANGLVLLFI